MATDVESSTDSPSQTHQVKPLWHRQTFLSSCSNSRGRLKLLMLTLEAFFSIYLCLAHWALQPPVTLCRRVGTFTAFSPHTTSPLVPATAATLHLRLPPRPWLTSPLLPWLVKPAFPSSSYRSRWKEKKATFQCKRAFLAFTGSVGFCPGRIPDVWEGAGRSLCVIADGTMVLNGPAASPASRLS